MSPQAFKDGGSQPWLHVRITKALLQMASARSPLSQNVGAVHLHSCNPLQMVSVGIKGWAGSLTYVWWEFSNGGQTGSTSTLLSFLPLPGPEL